MGKNSLYYFYISKTENKGEKKIFVAACHGVPATQEAEIRGWQI